MHAHWRCWHRAEAQETPPLIEPVSFCLVPQFQVRASLSLNSAALKNSSRNHSSYATVYSYIFSFFFTFPTPHQ
jgi:hypothetical protein